MRERKISHHEDDESHESLECMSFRDVHRLNRIHMKRKLLITEDDDDAWIISKDDHHKPIELNSHFSWNDNKKKFQFTFTLNWIDNEKGKRRVYYYYIHQVPMAINCNEISRSWDKIDDWSPKKNLSKCYNMFT